MVVFLHVKANSKEVCEKISFPSIKEKSAFLMEI